MRIVYRSVLQQRIKQISVYRRYVFHVQVHSTTATQAVVGLTFYVHCYDSVSKLLFFFCKNYFSKKSAILRSSRLCVDLLVWPSKKLRQKLCIINQHHQRQLLRTSLRPPLLPPPRGGSPLDVEVLTLGDFPGRSGGSQDLLFDPELNAVQARAIALEAASSKTGRLGSPLDFGRVPCVPYVTYDVIWYGQKRQKRKKIRCQIQQQQRACCIRPR